jgi:hypothetical protein
MDADWSVEAAADDPILVVPWLAEPGDPSVTHVLGFIDLRSHTHNDTRSTTGNHAECDVAAVDRLPEAVQHAALRQALVGLNDAARFLRTAKCDVWEIGPDEMASLQARFDLAQARCGCGSYVDVLLADGFEAANLPVHEEWVRRMVRAVGEIDDAEGITDTGEAASCAEFIVRPACVDGAWGYAVTVYVWSVGDNAQTAEKRWDSALGAVVSAVVQTAPWPDRVTMCAPGE